MQPAPVILKRLVPDSEVVLLFKYVLNLVLVHEDLLELVLLDREQDVLHDYLHGQVTRVVEVRRVLLGLHSDEREETLLLLDLLV